MENGQNVRLPLIFIIFIVAILKVFISDYFPSELNFENLKSWKKYVYNSKIVLYRIDMVILMRLM